MFSSTDKMLMHRACKLARRGEGFVEPNPMVGAVVASSDGTVLGEGWHKRFGSAHAEVHALAMAGEAARGATLFVTLEPCCHTGKMKPRRNFCGAKTEFCQNLCCKKSFLFTFMEVEKEASGVT